MLQLLTDLEHAWPATNMSREEELWLNEHFTAMLGMRLLHTTVSKLVLFLEDLVG